MKTTLYQLLGIESNAEQTAIDKAYAEQTERFQAKRNNGDMEAANQLVFLRDAYAVLSDPAKRADYDIRLAKALESKLAAPASNPNGKSTLISVEQDTSSYTPARSNKETRESTGKVGRFSALPVHHKAIILGTAVLAIVGVSAFLPSYLSRYELSKRAIEFTPQMFLKHANDFEIVRLFLKGGMQPDTRNSRGQTALMAAVESGNRRSMQTLIKAGAKIDAKSDNGRTALYYAVAAIVDLTTRGRDIDSMGLVKLFRDMGHPEEVLAPLAQSQEELRESEVRLARIKIISSLIPAIHTLLEYGANPFPESGDRALLDALLSQPEFRVEGLVTSQILVSAMERKTKQLPDSHASYLIMDRPRNLEGGLDSGSYCMLNGYGDMTCSFWNFENREQTTSCIAFILRNSRRATTEIRGGPVCSGNLKASEIKLVYESKRFSSKAGELFEPADFCYSDNRKKWIGDCSLSLIREP